VSLAKPLDFERGFLVKNLAIVCLLIRLCLLVCLIFSGGWDLIQAGREDYIRDPA